MRSCRYNIFGIGLAIGFTACFPAVDQADDVLDTMLDSNDSAGSDTLTSGDTAPLPDTSPLDCSSLDRVCARGVPGAPGAGCEQLLLHDEPCDDANPCTTNDRCDAGACAGHPLDCDDGVTCSIERCSVADGGCAYDTSACPCSHDADCADGRPCTSDVCDPTSWSCVNDVAPGNACNDFDPCTEGDRCSDSGGCAGTAKVCDDSNLCTADSCDASGGDCVFEPLEGVGCDDGDACSVSDACVEGVCRAGYLASFAQDYPVYSGPFARLTLAALRVPNGSYLTIERRVYTGPEIGYTGIFGTPLTQSGAEELDASEAFFGYEVAGITYQHFFTATRAIVERSGDHAYLLTNQSYLGRSMLDGQSGGWGYVPPYDGLGRPRARGMTLQNGTAVLCGDTTSGGGEPQLWLGWVSDLDGSIAAEVQPAGGEGVRGGSIRAIAAGFIVAGVVAGADGDDVWVARLDGQGAIQWSRTYPAPLDQVPVTIVPTTTAIAVFARTASPVDGTGRAWVVRVGYDGQPLGETLPSDAEFYLADATDTPGGGYLVVGRRPKPAQWYTQAHVLWLDAAGALVSEQDGPATNNGYTSVQRTQTGYILTGSSGDLYYDSAGVLEVTDFDLNTPCDPTP